MSSTDYYDMGPFKFTSLIDSVPEASEFRMSMNTYYVASPETVCTPLAEHVKVNTNTVIQIATKIGIAKTNRSREQIRQYLMHYKGPDLEHASTNISANFNSTNIAPGS